MAWQPRALETWAILLPDDFADLHALGQHVELANRESELGGAQAEHGAQGKAGPSYIV